MIKRIIFLFLILLLAACNSPTPEPTSTPIPPTPEPTIAPSSTATIEPTNAPTSTPMLVEDTPGLELLSGNPDTCVNAEDYGVVLAFQAHYYETTTENRVGYRMTDVDGNVIVEDIGESENKDGEEGWGFYPLAYELPENSLITVEVTVYASDAEDAPATSRSVLIYNCTTGETTETSFERNP